MSAHLPLLATKFRVPPVVATLIARPRLHAQLNDGLRLGRHITLISAPAGYGKTTLLRDWAQHCRRPVAWLSLDADDRDPARFLAYLVAALRQIDVVVGEPALASLASFQPWAAQVAASALLHAIEASGRALVLILDDYHLLQASPVHDMLAYLLDHQPPQAHIVIASRADPPLPLARLRARGQLSELRQRDLRFTAPEATALLNHMLGLGLADDDVAVLAARTEGWVAGLHLAAISLQAHDDAHRFIQDFKGSNRHILDYLIEEVLQRQPRDVQSFLLQTSILNRFTSALCDAVAEQGAGQAMLELLERANLFIVPLDDERTWYRYHRLFADLLRKRLGELYPERVPALHRRASVWHEQQGLMAEAIDHALLAQDFERAALLIERFAETTLMRGEAATFLTWITALPEALIRTRPALCVYHAGVLLLGGSPLDAVEARLNHAGDQSTLLTLPLRARVASYRGDLAQAAELAQRALDHIPDHHVLLRGLAALNLAWTYHASGDLAASQRCMQAAALSGHSPDHALIAVTAECYRADLYRREGQLRQAQALYQHALDLATDARGARLPIASRALVGLGELAREWNQLDQATHYILEGIGLAGRWVQVGVFEAYLTLARIRQAQADQGGIREALQMLRQVTIAFRATAVLARWVGMVEAWMQIVQGDLGEPRHWARHAGLSGETDLPVLGQRDDINLRRLHKYEVPIAARLWLAAGHPAEALALLVLALPHVEQINRTGQVIEYELLIALAAAALGQRSKAMQSLERALTLAAPEGFVRIFVDEGQPMARLLREAASQRIQPAYVGHLLTAFGQVSTTNSPIPDPRPSLVEPLSEREGEVLRLIAEGLSNDAIARRLVLALPTIKWHTSNIYGKLSVKNRTEAVAKARSLGLLPLA